jgi:hypothetical protein
MRLQGLALPEFWSLHIFLFSCLVLFESWENLKPHFLQA